MLIFYETEWPISGIVSNNCTLWKWKNKEAWHGFLHQFSINYVEL